MKRITLSALYLICMSLNAQVVNSQDNESKVKMYQINSKHSDSEGVKNIQASIENMHSVKCHGSSISLFPKVNEAVTYSANCYSNTQKILTLTIKSKFKVIYDIYEFQPQSYKVKFMNTAN